MLRLFSTAFALWVGVVFVLLAVSFAGVHARRKWLVPAALAAALVALLALDLANPEALVVRRNLDRLDRTGRVDVDYLAGLSDDAVPALVDALPRLDEAGRQRLEARICAAGPPPRGWLATNLGARRAEDARREACPGRA